ncbi:uncharacterized protein Hap1MRO34_007409 isoform 2-T2 [Clarias gariepinus]
MCECELRMKILLIFTLCLISDGGDSKEVTGYSGGGVLIKCKYKAGYTQNKKYFCKGSPPGCSNQIKTEAKNKWINSGRFSLYDDTKSAEFWVMIRELTVQDTGTYQCGVDISYGTDIYTPVELKIKEDRSYEKSISETVHVGGESNISCKYPESLRSNPKFLCKSLQSAICSRKASRTHADTMKFILYDDRERRILSVSIRNVTERDSGEYWCVAEADWESDDGYEVYFTQINLTVTETFTASEPHAPVSSLKPTQRSSSPSPPTPPSLSSSSSSSSTPLLLTNNHNSSWPTPSPPPPGFPASTVITVSVILLLLLIGVSFLTLTLQKRCKMQGTAFSGSSSVQDPGNNQGVSLDACEYEEIEDTGKLSAIADGTSTIYSTVQLPTVASDPSQPLYDNMVLHTTPPEKIIYSIAQSPTALSTEKSTYTTVNFHSKTTNDAMPQIVFKKEACDYALVNHVTSHR